MILLPERHPAGQTAGLQSRMATRNLLVKSMLGLAVLVGLGFLFAATLRDVASEPYIVRQDDLQRWTVEMSTRADPDGPLLVLRPPAALPISLFDQVFQRTMASFASPVEPGIPLILRREFEMALAGTMTSDELMSLARDVGLETTGLGPACMAVYRTAEGREQQLFFVLFDHPQFARFRAEVSGLLASRGGDVSRFSTDAVTPALLVASSEGARIRQIPSRADLEADCEAPVLAG